MTQPRAGFPGADSDTGCFGGVDDAYCTSLLADVGNPPRIPAIMACLPATFRTPSAPSLRISCIRVGRLGLLLSHCSSRQALRISMLYSEKGGRRSPDWQCITVSGSACPPAATVAHHPRARRFPSFLACSMPRPVVPRPPHRPCTTSPAVRSSPHHTQTYLPPRRQHKIVQSFLSPLLL